LVLFLEAAAAGSECRQPEQRVDVGGVAGEHDGEVTWELALESAGALVFAAV